MLNNHGTFVWYELSTTDVEGAKAYYSAVMGWDARDMSMPGLAYASFTLDGLPVCGLIPLPEDGTKRGGKPRWMGYIGVDEIFATTERIKQLGGTILLAPTDVFNFSRISIVADPERATFALVMRAVAGKELEIEPDAPGRVIWHELLATDKEKELAFYQALFGWQKAETLSGPMGTYQFVSTGQRRIIGIAPRPKTVPVSSWVYYFNVDDIDAAAKRVKAGGGKILEGPIEVPGGNWVIHCLDPQNALFALSGKRKLKAIVRVKGYERRDVSNRRAGSQKR